MKISERTKNIFYGGFLIVIGNIISQEDWGFTLTNAIIFIVGGLILPALITFMSDANDVNR